MGIFISALGGKGWICDEKFQMFRPASCTRVAKFLNDVLVAQGSRQLLRNKNYHSRQFLIKAQNLTSILIRYSMFIQVDS